MDAAMLCRICSSRVLVACWHYLMPHLTACANAFAAALALALLARACRAATCVPSCSRALARSAPEMTPLCLWLHLLSKRTNHDEDFSNFVCLSNGRTLMSNAKKRIRPVDVHGRQTPNEAFFIKFQLGQINSGTFGVFLAELSAPILAQ